MTNHIMCFLSIVINHIWLFKKSDNALLFSLIYMIFDWNLIEQVFLTNQNERATDFQNKMYIKFQKI